MFQKPTIAILLAVTALLLGAGPVAALDTANQNLNIHTSAPGALGQECAVRAEFQSWPGNTQMYAAYVMIGPYSNGVSGDIGYGTAQVAGDVAINALDVWDEGDGPITAQGLAACVNGATASEFTNITQIGPPPSADSVGMSPLSFLGVRFDFRGVACEIGFSGDTTTAWIASCPEAPANEAPEANAGPDQTVASAASVTLDGSGSSDPDAGQTLTYAWTQIAGPAVTLSDATAVSPGFTAPALATDDPDITLTFSLIVTDNLGLASAADTVTIIVSSAPSVTLSGAPSEINGTSPFTVTATFSKAVTGFNDLLNDVAVSNGAVTAISGGPLVYTLTITPTGKGGVSITVPAAAAQDSASNGNTASNILLIGNRTVEITRAKIDEFMLGRASNLASNQPGLIRFLDGSGCLSFTPRVAEDHGAVNGCVSREGIWVEATGSWSGDNSYLLGTIGAHATVNPNLLLGGMFQFDVVDGDDISGRGWMAGPYFAARLPEHPLYLEGRLLYGQTSNEITPLGTYTDDFETGRWLAQLKAQGEYQVDALTLMPLLDVTYTDESQKAYSDSLGNRIGGQTVSLMQVKAGLDFSIPIAVQTGSLALNGGLSAIYASTRGGNSDNEGLRGRAELGIDYGFGNSAALRARGFYDGIGSGHEGYGGSLAFEMKF